MTAVDLKSILPALQALNSWCRVPYDQSLGMTQLHGAIYMYKRMVIREAINLGIAKIRLVAVERPCKTCDGTGMFKRWSRYEEDYYDLETCRRCLGQLYTYRTRIC